MPLHCQVLGISPLLRELLIEAMDLPSEYDINERAGKIMSLAIEEIRAAPALPLSLPLPADEKLAERCQRFLERPSAQQTIDLVPRSRGQSPHFHTPFPARNGADLLGMAASRLSPLGIATPVARRTRDHACFRSRLFEPGGFRHHVQAADGHRAASLPT